MWIIFLIGFSIGGYFVVDENVHPEKYPETTAINAHVNER